MPEFPYAGRTAVVTGAGDAVGRSWLARLAPVSFWSIMAEGLPR